MRIFILNEKNWFCVTQGRSIQASVNDRRLPLTHIRLKEGMV